MARALPGGGRAEAATAGPGPGAGQGRAVGAPAGAEGPYAGWVRVAGAHRHQPRALGAPPAFSGLFQNVVISHVGRLTWFRCFCFAFCVYGPGIFCPLPADVKT